MGEGRTVEGVPEEDFAGKETAADFFNPGVVEGHPDRLGGTKLRWHDVLPESGCLDILAAGVIVNLRLRNIG